MRVAGRQVKAEKEGKKREKNNEKVGKKSRLGWTHCNGYCKKWWYSKRVTLTQLASTFNHGNQCWGKASLHNLKTHFHYETQSSFFPLDVLFALAIFRQNFPLQNVDLTSPTAAVSVDVLVSHSVVEEGLDYRQTISTMLSQRIP